MNLKYPGSFSDTDANAKVLVNAPLVLTAGIVGVEGTSKGVVGANLAQNIAGVDKAMPWHISRFHPDYKFRKYGLTPEATLKKAHSIGIKAGLEFIYIGNVGGWGNNTPCPACKKILIKREYFNILEYNIKENKCIYCQEEVPGVF